MTFYEIVKLIGIIYLLLFIFLYIIAKVQRNHFKKNKCFVNQFENKKVIFVYDENDSKNADGKKGHLLSIGDSEYIPKFYEKIIKRFFDLLISFISLMFLIPVFLLISICIKFEDPGPIFFTQNRIGKNKKYFKLYKFRSMKTDAPRDTPTHMLKNPEQHITKIGKFLRLHSLDELPQIWNIFVGDMSIIGPRPALWNQDVLVSERDKYNANDIRPGLTGLAQINGRDELEIEQKAKLDGDYVESISLLTDIKIFLASFSVFKNDISIIEGKQNNK